METEGKSGEQPPQNTIHQIAPALWLGGYRAAADADLLKQHGITRVVKLFRDEPEYHGGACRHPGVEYHVIDAEDTPQFDLRPCLPDAIRFIAKGVASGKKTLVHCHMGVSRSPTVAAVYIMAAHKVDAEMALAYLRSIRDVVNPNPGFRKLLAAIDRQMAIARSRRRRRNSWPLV